MIQVILAAVLSATWNGTFDFRPPELTSAGIPVIPGTVNVQEPGVPMYPVKTIFVPVPSGAVPVLDYSAMPSAAAVAVEPIPRSGILSGSGLNASVIPAEPVDFTPSTVELRDVVPLAGTTVAVIDIYPYTERGFVPEVTVRLEWSGVSGAVPIPQGHLLQGLAEGGTYWPDPVQRAESPFWGKPWARISIEEEGPYSITADMLESAGCPVSGVQVETLALFSGPGTQFDDAPETEHQLLPVSCVVEDLNEDGVFQDGDRIIFLAQGLNRYEFLLGGISWLWHRYATHRVYWLTWGGESGRRMPIVPGSPDGSPEWGEATTHRIRFEEGGYWMPRWETRTGWFGQRLLDGDAVSVPAEVPVPAGNGQVTVSFAVTESTDFTLQLAGAAVHEGSGLGRHAAVFEDVDLIGLNEFLLEFDSNDPGAEMLLDYIEVEYPVELTSSSRRLFFPEGRGRYSFSFTGGSMAFTMVDPMNPSMISGAVQIGGALQFACTVADSVSLVVADQGDLLTPDSISPAEPGRLVGTVSSGDRLLVVPDTFQDDVSALEALLGSMGYSVITATVREVYDEFGQGVKDPGAIRSAVRWGMDSWTQPLSGLILCGDGHYDPLGYSTTIPDLIPAMIYLRNDPGYPAWASEDWFAQVHQNSTYPEIMVARIPAGNAAAFGAICAKSAIYASGQAGGSWSGRFVLFADDEWGNYSPTEDEHTEYIEEICYSSLGTCADPEKFYLIEYPWPPGTTPDGIHPEKPEAREDFLELWNRGMGALLFFGHGSANQIAHEKVMLGEDPASLENGARLPIAMFFSCDLSRFFNPGVDCIGEKVVYHPGGGAVASIGATGGTTAPGNFGYASSVTELLTQDANTMGYSFWAGKLRASRAGTSAYYVYLGCPDLTLGMSQPGLSVSLSGDTLRTGEINGVTGTCAYSDGLVLLEITESDIPWQYQMLEGGTIDYYREGGTAWRGRAALSQGAFSAQCILPASSATGELARIDGAAVMSDGVELGASAPLTVVDGDPDPDFQGPSIEMWIAGQQGVPEPVVTGEAPLEASLSDPSGINFLGRIGNGIQLFVNDQEFDLSDYFTYNTGSTETGQLQYTVPDLPQGQHQFILRASDGAGNVSMDTLAVTSTDQAEVAIQQHLVYPNPGSGVRCFSFSLSTEAHVTVSIYTVAGRCLKRLSSQCVAGYNQMIWDGLDADGDIPASGAYIYVIEARTESGLFNLSSSVNGILATVN